MRRSPQFVPVTPQGGVGSRCPPARARRARCTRHEARARIAAVTSCCLVRLSNGGLGPLGEIVSLPACTQRSIRHVAAVAGRLDPLAFSGDSRGRSKALFSLCSTEQPSQIQNRSIFHETQRTGPSDEILQRQPRKTSSPLTSASPLALQLYHHSTGFPHAWRTTSATLRTPTLGDDSSLFAVTQQPWRACVRRLLRCKLACILPPSSLNPRLASGVFAVAKYENHDRFIGDRRPLNSRERSNGRAHLAFCPQLRRMMLEKSETVQITIRDTKDCFNLYEVPPPRVAKQVIGRRIPRS